MKKIYTKRKEMKLITSLLFLSLIAVISAQPARILLLNGYLHVGNGETIDHAFIGIKNGLITDVGNSLITSYNKSEWDTIINLENKHIYPGFVAGNSTLGLTEIDAVRATRDYNETGSLNPHVRTQIAYNVESKVISTVLTNGVLLCQATPRGGIISGTSSVMTLHGWNWEDATIYANDGIHVNWPSSLQGGGWWAEPAPKKQNENYSKQLKELNEFFEMAKTYANASKSDLEYDQRLDAMKECFSGTKRVYFHADEMQQIIDVIEFSKKYNINFPVVIGGYEAHLLGSRMKDSKIPVMLRRIHSLPENDDDPVDQSFKLPYLLKKEGVLFSIQNSGDMEAMNARNLPFQAGTSTSYGLTEEEAVESISLSPCRIMGIDKKYGSVEKGKSATLFVSEGNALEMKTNKPTLILINGKFTPTTNFQNELYKKYSDKYLKN
jgi:imidazolonepropionase-like amidohydrolase